MNPPVAQAELNRPAPVARYSAYAAGLPAGSLARNLIIRLLLPILLLVALDLTATWVITHKIDLAIWVLEDVFWFMVAGQTVLIVLCIWVVIQGVRSGLRSVNHLSLAICQRSIDDMEPLEVTGLPREIAPVVTHINDLLARLDLSLSAQRRFIHHAAHQLRTPLSGLRLESELMLARSLPEEVRVRVERIKVSSDRMIRLGQQLLVLARVDPHVRAHTSFVRIDLCEWVRTSGAEWVPQVRAAGAELQLTAPDKPVWIEGDPLLLHELLGNLIDNALRYGAPAGRIALSVQANPPSLTVEDNGPGIAVEERERVFEAFYRSPRVTASGSGLGLAIVREIAQAHGVVCQLMSRPEFAGTRLSFVFPVAGQEKPLPAPSGH